jgi:hypothetical protein
MSLSTSPKEELVSVAPAMTVSIPTVPTVLLGLPEASTRLGINPKQLRRLANIRDIAYVELDGELYFRPEALIEWAIRHERKVW